MQKTFSHEQVFRELCARASRVGQTELAKQLGISRSMMNDLLRQRRDISDRIAEALGYTREVIFRRKAA